MSYNGIGLNTPRGTGTNGFVQRNIQDLKSKGRGPAGRKHYENRELERNSQEREDHNKVTHGTDSEIIEHDRKRKLEVQVAEYRDRLEEDEALSDGDIERKVKKYREKLRSRSRAEGEKNGNNNNNEGKQRDVRQDGRSPRRYDTKVDPFQR